MHVHNYIQCVVSVCVCLCVDVGAGGVGWPYIIYGYITVLPSSLFTFAGNDCLFEYNSLSDLCYEVTDSGAFYSGRSWIDRGNIIQHSVFKNIVTTEKVYLGYPSVQAIYLDDQVRECMHVTIVTSMYSYYTYSKDTCLALYCLILPTTTELPR